MRIEFEKYIRRKFAKYQISIKKPNASKIPLLNLMHVKYESQKVMLERNRIRFADKKYELHLKLWQEHILPIQKKYLTLELNL